MLSRITWPSFQWEEVRDGIEAAAARKEILRICLQTVLYRGYEDDMFRVLEDIPRDPPVLVSVALTPVSRQTMERLKSVGVDRVGIALDASTPELFSLVKGKAAGSGFSWENHMAALDQALAIFGRGRVTTHLIAGCGETEKELIETMQRIVDKGISVGLFAFMPIQETKMAQRPQPQVKSFRRVQLARHFLMRGTGRVEGFGFDPETGALTSFGIEKSDLAGMIRESSGRMFETSGCPGCNRPYYTSKPGGPVYNYPGPLTPEQLSTALADALDGIV